MDPSSSGSLPSQQLAGGIASTPTVDQPLPLFPTRWTPSSHTVPTAIPSHIGTSSVSSSSSRSGSGTGSENQSPSETKPPANSSSSPARIRRRNRMITSCLECRRRKLKCDRMHPCSSCYKSNRNCLFLTPATDPASRMKFTEIKDRIGSLERALEQDAVTPHGNIIKQEDTSESRLETENSAVNSGGIVDTVVKEESQLPVPDDEKNLEPTPLAVQDAAYEDEGDDNVFDLGFKFGKMRMTDRIGGFFRPRIADELSAALDMLHVSDPPKTSTPASAVSFEQSRRWSSIAENPHFRPSPSYAAPSSDLCFGGASQYTLMEFLPTQVAADRLLRQYWEAVHPVAKIVHRPTFEKQYSDFWANVSQGIEPPYSLQALFFSTLFSAVISMAEDTLQAIFRVPQKQIIQNFQGATEMALAKANFLRTTKTQTLQALVMYIIPMCRDEISRSHSTLVGAAIRLAECMGFHRDPEEYGHGPVESHVRRMIWYHICFLDLQTSEMQGPRPSIRREDFSTKFPVNMDDAELATADPTSISDMPRWTDMTLTRIRFECCELRRLILVDRIRLEKKQVSLTQVLAKIEAFRKATIAKYGPLILVPNPQPIQQVAKYMLSILTRRAYISLLHRYLNTVAVRIPDRLAQIVITNGMQILDASIALESSAELRPWAWYHGAFNNYHIALLLLFEIWTHPERKEADHIWECLDYAFELDATAPDLARNVDRLDVLQHRDAKARFILRTVRNGMMEYREARRLIIPKSMSNSKVLPPIPLDVDSYTASLTRRTQSAPTRSPLAPISEARGTSISYSHNLPTDSIPNDQQFQTQFNSPKGVQQSYLPQQANTFQYTAPPAPVSQLAPPTFLSPSYGQPASFLQEPQPIQKNRSIAGLEDAGNNGLWFLSNTGLASAGAAPSVGGYIFSPAAGETQLSTPEIDWNEWDQIFTPDVHNMDL
ncbi:hypothetical protein LOY97_001993 [Ophidiomyces ophidiicola]|nr:hypothetical protein LOZ49_001720 [Ophidiomyces ophidiicola]KAI2134493.1 hypothetical protein LOZ28_004943 [Ophidiomyces ophidiicola]KAI2214202.1 hypothetical protein LOZ15_004861 [Ophidiomyces ophidiicola]KAI2460744.1 hypothetical protein LOY97_001993 [Ophidiomyces ophidiicola]